MTNSEFEILALSLRQRLLRSAGAITGSADDAADVVQDAMLKLWSMRHDLGEYNSVEALASIMVKRMALNVVRNRRPSSPLELCDGEAAVPSVEDIVIDRQKTEYVDRILAALPDTQQTLLRLRHIEGYDNASIAELLGSTEGAVRTALSRARRAVAAMFNVSNL